MALCDGGALQDARCVYRMCVCGHTLPLGFLCLGCVRVRSGAAYFPYIYTSKALAVVNDAYESSLIKLCECLHRGLEEGGVVGHRGGVGVGVVDLSFGSASLNLGSCCG
jgi:hypothetical protein